LIGEELTGSNWIMNSLIMFKKLEYPWLSIGAVIDSDQNFNIDENIWTFQLLVDSDHKLINSITGEKLPSKLVSDNQKIYDLPSPAMKGDNSREISLTLGKIKFKLKFYNVDRIEHDYNEKEKFELFFDKMLDSTLFFFREALESDKYIKKNNYWKGVLKKIHQNKENDPAKYSLIVDLARPEELVNPIDRITMSPKKILKRIHDQERVQKVKEVDVKCLIDLARRPGSILAEKAGSKQRILAIKRKENINILENKVTKHCCWLVANSSKRYLKEHLNIDSKLSPRKRAVESLIRKSKTFISRPSFSSVSNLSEPSRTPNYTLMQNPDYLRVWKAYLQLVKNEDLRSDLWKWNQRLWSDFIGIFISDLITNLNDKYDDDTLVQIGKKTVFGERIFNSGQRIFKDTLPGPFLMNPNSENPKTIYLINGDQKTIKNLSKEFMKLSELNADYLLIVLEKKCKSVLPIYSIIPSHTLKNGALKVFIKKMNSSLLNQISNNKRSFSDWFISDTLILLGNWSEEPLINKITNLGQRINSWVDEVNPDFRYWNKDQNKYLKIIQTFLKI
jgi:hypothetical protein